MSKQKIGEASLILAGGTILSNLFQILKMILISRLFGATSGLLDPYVVALRVPMAVQGIILGTLQMSFIPVYVGHLARKEHDRAERVLGSTFSFGMLFYGLFAGLLGIWAMPILRPLAPEFDAQQMTQAVDIFRILLVMLFLNGITDLISGFYQGNQRYLLPALAPVLGIGVSVLYLWAFPEQGVYNLAYGLVLGSAAQVALLLWGTSNGRAGFRVRASRAFISRECVPIYRMMLPVAGGLLLANANQLIDVGVAARLGRGAVTVLDFASRFHDVIMKLFAASIGGALLPFLAQYVAQERHGDFRSTLALGTRLSILTLLPTAVVVYLFGTETISAMLLGGKFTAHDAAEVGAVWAAYAVGLFVITDAIFLSRGMIAVGDLQPLWITVAFCIPLNIALDVLLAAFVGVKGIALATALVYLVYMVVYRWRLGLYYKRTGAPPPALSALWKTLAAIAVFSVIAVGLRAVMGPLLEVNPSPTPADRLLTLASLALAVGAAGGAYLALLRLFRIEEAAMLFRFAKRLLRLPSA